MSNKLRPRPQEPAPEQELASVLQQIEAITGIKPGSDVVEEKKRPEPDTVTNKELPQAPSPAPTMAPIVETPPPVINYLRAGEVNVYDVVQVINSKSKYYGVLFIVGDMVDTTIHGFYVTPGGGREFVTVDISEIKTDKACGIMGEAIVKARNPCSEEWNTRYGKENQARQ